MIRPGGGGAEGVEKVRSQATPTLTIALTIVQKLWYDASCDTARTSYTLAYHDVQGLQLVVGEKRGEIQGVHPAHHVVEQEVQPDHLRELRRIIGFRTDPRVLLRHAILGSSGRTGSGNLGQLETQGLRELCHIYELRSS